MTYRRFDIWTVFRYITIVMQIGTDCIHHHYLSQKPSCHHSPKMLYLLSGDFPISGNLSSISYVCEFTYLGSHNVCLFVSLNVLTVGPYCIKYQKSFVSITKSCPIVQMCRFCLLSVCLVDPWVVSTAWLLWLCCNEWTLACWHSSLCSESLWIHS